MTFKPKIWFPIAVILTLVNVAGTWIAAAATEPAHATLHAVLGAACAVWAQRLRSRSASGGRDERIEELEETVGDMEQQLAEAQERLDFAERILAQGAEGQRADREK